jgi:YtkA-like
MNSDILRTCLAAALLCIATACSGGAPSGPATFPAEAYATATSDSGALAIDVRTSPQPPARGTNSVQLTVTQVSDGTPVDGLVLDVVPWMTAMGHGTSTPTVTAQGGGVYLVTEVYTYMPGVWALQTTISGTMTDYAAPQLTVP